MQTSTPENPEPGIAKLQFLKSVELYLRAPDLPEVLVGRITMTSPATGLKEIALSCPDQDLKEYLKNRRIRCA